MRVNPTLLMLSLLIGACASLSERPASSVSTPEQVAGTPVPESLGEATETYLATGVGDSGGTGKRFLAPSGRTWPAPITSRELLAAAEESDKPASGSTSEEDLRKKTQNPIANMITVPIETIFDFGADNGNAIFIQLQPVIPFNVGKELIVSRTIIPFISAPGGIPGFPGNPEPVPGPREFGLGDILQTLFWVPKGSDKVI